MNQFESDFIPAPSPLEKIRSLSKEAKLLMVGLAMTLQTTKGEAPDTSTALKDNTVEYKIKEQEQKNFDPSSISFDEAYDRFTIIEDGKPVFNYWSLLAPVQVDGSYKKDIEGIAKAEVPYLYSRNFDLAKATNPEDQKKIISYIEQQLKKQLVDAITYLDFSDNTEKVREAHREDLSLDLNNVSIKKIKITGLASPEGPENKGPESLFLGKIDKENIDLSEKRAESMDPLVREALSNMGIDEKVVAEIEGIEVQFSDEEMGMLGSLAKELAPKNLDDNDAMFWLTKEYNSGAFMGNPEVQKQLDHLFASKRGISIEIEYENKQKQIVVIPIPFALLLLLLVKPTASLIKKSFEKPIDYNFIEEAPKMDRYVFSEQSENPDVKEKKEATDFKDLYEHAFEKVSPVEFGKMMERMFVDEIYEYKDDPRTIRLGLDYLSISTIINRHQTEKGENDGAFEGTKLLLSAWQNYDRSVRELEGLSKKEVVPYDTDLSKIAWARLTSEQIVSMNREAKESNRSFEEVLSGVATNLSNHRIPGKKVLNAGSFVMRKK